MAELIIAQLPKHEKYILIAESFAGPLAIKIGSRRPSNLMAIIFAASFAKKPNKLPEQLSIFAKFIPFSSTILSRMIRPITFGRWGNKELDTLVHVALNRVSRNVIINRINSLMHIDEIHKLRDLNLPMLYVRPTSDRLVNRNALQAMVNVNSTIEITEIQGPHFILQCQPQLCINMITDFINRVE